MKKNKRLRNAPLLLRQHQALEDSNQVIAKCVLPPYVPSSTAMPLERPVLAMDVYSTTTMKKKKRLRNAPLLRQHQALEDSNQVIAKCVLQNMYEQISGRLALEEDQNDQLARDRPSSAHVAHVGTVATVDAATLMPRSVRPCVVCLGFAPSGRCHFCAACLFGPQSSSAPWYCSIECSITAWYRQHRKS